MENRMQLYGLAMECPQNDDCKDCPLRELRKLNDFEKIVEIIDNMTDEEVFKISLYHNKRRYESEKHLWNNQIEIRPKTKKND
jgi:hypothetical protein